MVGETADVVLVADVVKRLPLPLHNCRTSIIVKQNLIKFSDEQCWEFGNQAGT